MKKGVTILLVLIILTFHVLCQSIRVNEYQSSNDTTIVDFQGDNPDWLELYNMADSAVNLQGWFLSDDPEDLFKWQFPLVIIPSDYYMLVFASDKDTIFPNGEIHINFKISNGDESLYLSNADSMLLDVALATDLLSDWSFGRFPDGDEDWLYFNIPTPGESNGTQPFVDFAGSPTFSQNAGFSQNPFFLEIQPATEGDTIYYTLDGSEPTLNSMIYSGPIQMVNRSSDPNRLSLIRTTLPGIGFYHWAAPNGIVYKFNVVRARVFKTGMYPSEIVSSSFIVDPDISSRYTFPIISLISDSLNFFCDTIGIYKAGYGIDSLNWLSAHFAQEGMAWERPVHIEYFEPDGTMRLSQDGGVRIHGGYSTTANIKSLRLYARGQYGKSKFDYKLFPKLDQNEFETFILRNAGQDFAWSYFRDPFMQSLVEDWNFDTQDNYPVVVFLDGEYWGIHWLTERYDKFYLNKNYGVPEDGIDFLELANDVIEGDAVHYNAMVNYIKTHDMSNQANYEYVKTQMDVDNYCSYICSNIFFCQSDWPQNNIKYWRKRTESYLPEAPYGHDGRWRWMLFDTDYGFGRVQPYSYNNLYAILSLSSGWSPLIMQYLIGNQQKPGNLEFRNMFINTLADMMNTNFKVDRMLAAIDAYKAMLLPEIQDHIQRWNGIGNTNIWNNNINVMRTFASNRTQLLRGFIVNQFADVTGSATVTLNSEVEKGKIKINKVLIDHNTPGNENAANPYPWSGVYFQGAPITLIAIPEPGYYFVEWPGISTEDTITVNLSGDALFTAIFQKAVPDAGDIVINEINYHSPLFFDSGEWIEIYNNSNNSFKTDGWALKNSGFENITFPADFNIAAKSYLIICNDLPKFQEKYPGISCFEANFNFETGQSYQSALLILNSDSRIDSVNINTSTQWPISPNGYGPSLELNHPENDNLALENWRASYKIGGTPGIENSKPVNALKINEFMAKNATTITAPDGSFSDWIEIYNTCSQPVDMGGLYFTDDPDERNKWQIPVNQPELTTVSPFGFALLWADEQTGQGPLHLDFKLAQEGEFIGIYGSDLVNVIDTLGFGPQQADICMGVLPDGRQNQLFFNNPTPGAANGLVHYIDIPAGWSGLSSYLKPYNGSLESIFAERIESLIFLGNSEGFFFPAQNTNTLGEWNSTDAFNIKASEPMNLKISSLQESYREIQIGSGWSVVPCLSSSPVSVADLWEEYEDMFLIIKEIAGVKMFWPANGIVTLGELLPGKAYLIFAVEEFDLEFPD